MKRILILVSAVLASALVYGSSTPIASATDSTPPVGSWQWCTDTLKNGCIEAVTTISPEKVETTYRTAAELPSGLTVSATCSSNSSVNTCDTNRYITRDDGQCTETSTWGGRVTTPSIEIDARWTGMVGWGVRIRFSTGNFRAAFSIGYGITATQTTRDEDGTYTYTLTSFIGKSYSAMMPQSVRALMGTPQYMPAMNEWIKTAIATSEQDAAHVQVWPRDHLLQNSSPVPTFTNATSTLPLAPTAKGCQYYPFDGAFAEANASSFSWSYSAGNMSSTVPNVLKFVAQAPHYLPQKGSEPLQVMAARVQVFLPTAYFSALGYASLSEFNASSYSVTTEDGQTTTPTVTARDNGILINLGLQHYSAPNPSVTFVPKGAAISTTDTLASTSPLPAYVTTTTAAPKVFSALKKLGKKKSAPLSSFISYSSSGSKAWKVTGGCRIVKSKLQAPSRAATCKLTLTVRNAKKKVIATKSHTIRVS